MSNRNTMNDEEFKATRNVLRWAGVGALPSSIRAQSALDSIAHLKGTVLQAVGSVLEDIRKGVLVSAESCKTANTQLTQVYAAQQGNKDAPRESDRG